MAADLLPVLEVHVLDPDRPAVGRLQKHRKERHQSLTEWQQGRKERHQLLAEWQQKRMERHQSMAEWLQKRKEWQCVSLPYLQLVDKVA